MCVCAHISHSFPQEKIADLYSSFRPLVPEWIDAALRRARQSIQAYIALDQVRVFEVGLRLLMIEDAYMICAIFAWVTLSRLSKFLSQLPIHPPLLTLLLSLIRLEHRAHTHMHLYTTHVCVYIHL